MQSQRLVFDTGDEIKPPWRKILHVIVQGLRMGSTTGGQVATELNAPDFPQNEPMRMLHGRTVPIRQLLPQLSFVAGPYSFSGQW
jgi:hypothetical protein